MGINIGLYIFNTFVMLGHGGRIIQIFIYLYVTYDLKESLEKLFGLWVTFQKKFVV